MLTLACEHARPEAELNAQFVYPLCNLMTFLFDEAQQVKRVSLWQHEIFAVPEDDPEVQVIRALVHPQEDAEADEDSGRLEELFSITEVVPRFAQLISDWLRISDTFSAACNLFFGLKYRPPGFVDLTFVVVVQTLLLYYTRRDDGRAECATEAERLERVVAALSEEQGRWLHAHLGSQPFPPVPHVLDTLLREHDEALGPLIRGERGVRRGSRPDAGLPRKARPRDGDDSTSRAVAVLDDRKAALLMCACPAARTRLLPREGSRVPRRESSVPAHPRPGGAVAEAHGSLATPGGLHPRGVAPGEGQRFRGRGRGRDAEDQADHARVPYQGARPCTPARKGAGVSLIAGSSPLSNRLPIQSAD